MKRVLVIVRASPQGGIRAREALDLVLLFSAFAPGLALLFSGEAAWQLLPGQADAGDDTQPVGRMLGALAQYDVDQVYVDEAALVARGIDADQLAIAATALDAAGIRALIARHDTVLSL